MKRIILSVLALGLTMGAMAQKYAEKLTSFDAKFNGSMPKSTIVYTEAFDDCASLDNPQLYASQSILQSVLGTNVYMDLAYGQMYNGTNYQISGIAAMMSKLEITAGSEDMFAVLYDATGYQVGQELARVQFSTDELLSMGTDDEGYVMMEFEMLQLNFNQPVSSSNFMCAIEVAPLTITADGSSVEGVLSFVASTEQDCYSGDGAWSYSDLEGTGEYSWVTISEAWGGLNLDAMIFPIVEGNASLTDVELNAMSYVYPNPAKSEVMLASSFSINKVEVMNVLGQVVFASDVNANSIKVNTSDFAAGSYIVKMYTESGVATKKLVVE